jgi:hypothetical protein
MAAFTTIAVGAGMALSAGSAGASFAQAGKQRQLQQKAEAEAAKSLEEARKRTEVNVYDQIGIQKEPYALQREAMLVQGAQGIQAAMEGDQRGVAATAGRIQAAQNEAQAQITAAMGKEMTDLEKLQAAEQARLTDINIGLDQGQIMGAQQAAADARNRAVEATQAGFTSLASMAKQGIEGLVPLFPEQAVAPVGTTNTSLQSANDARLGVSGTFTAPQFQTNPAFMGGLNPFAITPSINYQQAPIGFNRGAVMPFGGNVPAYNPTPYQFNFGG